MFGFVCIYDTNDFIKFIQFYNAWLADTDTTQ